jgi:hypothetical protein
MSELARMTCNVADRHGTIELPCSSLAAHIVAYVSPVGGVGVKKRGSAVRNEDGGDPRYRGGFGAANPSL